MLGKRNNFPQISSYRTRIKFIYPEYRQYMGIFARRRVKPPVLIFVKIFVYALSAKYSLFMAMVKPSAFLSRLKIPSILGSSYSKK